MATSMWRMNGLCRKMPGVLVFCTLLLSSVVVCQEPATDSPATNVPTGNDPANPTPALQSVAPSVVGEQSHDTSAYPGYSLITMIMTVKSIPGTDVPAVAGNDALAAEASDSSSNVKNSKESNESSSSSDSSVFAGILVSGLLAALGITAGYLYCQRRPDTKAIKLTDEAYPADQENQGSTLASVAPLNPPPETQDKPNVNGESPEAAKTQPPPSNNGHSTTKTADTEL